MKKRIFPLLLVLVMVLGLSVTTVWGDENLTQSSLSSLTKSDDNYKGYWLTGGTYKLGEKITLTYPIKVSGKVTLDLNGYTISQAADRQNTLILTEGSALTLKDSSNSGSGGTVKAPSASSGCYSIKLDENSKFKIEGGIVETIYFANENANATMYADGGTVTGVVHMRTANCTITTTPDTEKPTTFEGSLTNRGIISGGTFTNTVSNTGTISGGTFNGNVSNLGAIEGGTFYGTVSGSGTIDDSACWTVTFRGADGISDAKVLKGSQKVARPDDPTKTGCTFTGWYTDEKCEGTEYDFNTPVTTDLTLYAGWEKQPTETSYYYYTTTEKIEAPKTFDPGAAVYGVMAALSLTGMAYMGKKKS